MLKAVYSQRDTAYSIFAHTHDTNMSIDRTKSPHALLLRLHYTSWFRR